MNEQTTASLAPWCKEPRKKEPPFLPPKAPYPWRRFFARGLDFALIQTAYQVILAVFLHSKLLDRSIPLDILDNYLCWGILLLLEPLCLAKWGKTPGKWLFGISIHNKNGGLLTWQEAFQRTLHVFCQGEGYGIPFYNLYRNYRSYQLCLNSGVMEWDQDLRYEAKPFYAVSALGYLIAMAVATAVTINVGYWQMTPPNKGILTTAEFAENYNYQLDYFDMESIPRLTPEGKWATPEQEGYLFSTSSSGTVLEPVFSLSSTVTAEPAIQEQNGTLASFSFTVEDTEGGILSPSARKTWLTAALLRTQINRFYPELKKVTGDLLSSDDAEEQPPSMIPSVLIYIEEHPYCSYVIETGNLRISQEVTLVGYEEELKHISEYLFTSEDVAETYYSLTFTLEQFPVTESKNE